MNSERLTTRVGEVGLVGTGFLRGYRHLFNKLGRDGSAKGNVEPLPSSRVWGVVYEINNEQLEALDVHEGGYNRVLFEVSVDESLIEVIGYKSQLITTEVLPTNEYLGHYVAGARQHRLPDDYVRSILPDWYSW